VGGIRDMQFKEELNKILEVEEIVKYINEQEKIYIENMFNSMEEEFEAAYEFENNRNRIGIVIFYNIVMINEDLRKRKLGETKSSVFGFKNLAKILGISEKSLYELNNKFNEKFPQYKDKIKENKNKIEGEDGKLNKLQNSLIRNISKNRRKTEPQQINMRTLATIFKYTYEYLKVLYVDKNAIKITEFLTHVQLNLFLAGHKVEQEKLEELFGESLKYLDVTLTDGRNEEDFVKVKDNYGNIENKVFIEFRR
jgi:hypothetical protein